MNDTSDRNDDLVEVYVARDMIHAHLVKAALDARNLETFVDGEHLQGLVGEIPAWSATAPRLLTRSDNVGRVKVAIEEIENERLEVVEGNEESFFDDIEALNDAAE